MAAYPSGQRAGVGMEDSIAAGCRWPVRRNPCRLHTPQKGRVHSPCAVKRSCRRRRAADQWILFRLCNWQVAKLIYSYCRSPAQRRNLYCQEYISRHFPCLCESLASKTRLVWQMQNGCRSRCWSGLHWQ